MTNPILVLLGAAFVAGLLIALFRGKAPAADDRAEDKAVEKHISTKPPVKPPALDSTTAVPIDRLPSIAGAAFVIDGDSIVIAQKQIRLYGVDAPELSHPYGQNAKWALVRLCKGQTVRADFVAADAHGRTVARCFLPDGRDLSAEMVKLGLAIDWPKFSGGRYRSLEVSNARKKMWLADARQKGRMQVWEKYEAQKQARHS